jgi:hypothetical protein
VLSALWSPIGSLFYDFKIRFSAYGENLLFTTYAVFHEYLFLLFYLFRLQLYICVLLFFKYTFSFSLHCGDIDGMLQGSFTDSSNLNAIQNDGLAMNNHFWYVLLFILFYTYGNFEFFMFKSPFNPSLIPL